MLGVAGGDRRNTPHCNQSMALNPEQVYKRFNTEIQILTYYFDNHLRDHAQILS